VKHGVSDALDAALSLGDTARLEELLAFVDELPAVRRPPYLDAQALRVRARRDGDNAGFTAAAARFHALGIPFWAAVTRLEHAEALGGGDEAERLLAEARETFERLGAKPWLERVDAALPSLAAVGADTQ
jgi:hypothetical protein